MPTTRDDEDPRPDALRGSAPYYAVRTTGVVCKRSCPSRAPKPENVVFFETLEAARAAGYRPCKRCKPDA